MSKKKSNDKSSSMKDKLSSMKDKLSLRYGEDKKSEDSISNEDIHTEQLETLSASSEETENNPNEDTSSEEIQNNSSEVTAEYNIENIIEDNLENITEDNSLSFADDDDDEIIFDEAPPETPALPHDIEKEEEELFDVQELIISSKEKLELEELSTISSIASSEQPQNIDLREESPEDTEDNLEQFEEMPIKLGAKATVLKLISNAKAKLSKSKQDDFSEVTSEHDFSEMQLNKATISEKIRSSFHKLNAPSKPSSLKNINFEDFITNIFAPESRSIIHKAFIVTILATGTYVTGKTAALFLSKPELQKPSSKRSSSRNIPRENYRKGFSQVKAKNLFNTLGADGNKIAKKALKPKTNSPRVCKSATKKSSLSITLINTIVLQDSVKSIAAVQVRGNKGVMSLREGEKVKSLAEIGRINPSKVILKNLKSGECEYISNVRKGKQLKPIVFVSEKKGKKLLKKKMAGITNEGNNYKIKKSVREKMFSNMESVLTQARAIRIKNSDGTESYKMADVVPGSIYSQLGIEDGDVVTEINGKKFKNLNELMVLFGKLRTMDNISITKKRDGSSTTSEYNFE